MSVTSEELERVIRQVFQEKPTDKFHETERLWEILCLLNVVSDTETPVFFNDLLEQEISPNITSDNSTSSSSSTPSVEENKFSSQFDFIKEGMKNITKFTESEQGTNILNMLPAQQRENLKSSIRDVTNENPLDNPLMKIFNNLFSGTTQK